MAMPMSSEHILLGFDSLYQTIHEVALLYKSISICFQPGLVWTFYLCECGLHVAFMSASKVHMAFASPLGRDFTQGITWPARKHSF